MKLPGNLMRTRLRSPIAATRNPQVRPATMVTSAMAGTKKRKLMRPCVSGRMSQCSSEATAASAIANTHR
jgi:hypothetical protein